MRKSLLALAVLGTFAAPAVVLADDAAPAAATPDYTLTYNVGAYSQYIFRGITQTDRKPAIQGGADFTHSSGLYIGTWASNISWLSDIGYAKSSLEWDIYGGYRYTFENGIGIDVGLLNYVYPGSKSANYAGTLADPYTLEGYAAVSYAWLQAKASVAATDLFGAPNSSGSAYYELNANYPIPDTAITLIGHAGRQIVENGSQSATPSYTDWKLGASYTFASSLVVGGYYTDTNLDKSFTGRDDTNVTAFVQKTF